MQLPRRPTQAMAPRRADPCIGHTTALQRRGNSPETRQHLAGSALTLRTALAAKLVRAS